MSWSSDRNKSATTEATEQVTEVTESHLYNRVLRLLAFFMCM